MKQKNFTLISIIIISLSCNPSDGDKALSLTQTTDTESHSSPKEDIDITTKAKFDRFNDIENLRQVLSSVGIGILGRWRDDEMGGFMSITSYYQFGSDNPPNNLAYYLESDIATSIKTLKLVLNINSGSKRIALSKFAEIVKKTYTVLGVTPNSQIISAAKSGQEAKVIADTHIEEVKLEKSRIETWEFVIETK